jgi:hypothetical protein
MRRGGLKEAVRGWQCCIGSPIQGRHRAFATDNGLAPIIVLRKTLAY